MNIHARRAASDRSMMMLLLPSPSKPRETSTRMLEICEMTIDWKSSPAQSAARLSQCSATQKLPASSAQSPDCSPSTVCGRRPRVGRAIGGAIERRGRRGGGGGGSDDADFRVVAAGRARERRWMVPATRRASSEVGPPRRDRGWWRTTDETRRAQHLSLRRHTSSLRVSPRRPTPHHACRHLTTPRPRPPDADHRHLPTSASPRPRRTRSYDSYA
jgi:hypothetical protein